MFLIPAMLAMKPPPLTLSAGCALAGACLASSAPVDDQPALQFGLGLGLIGLGSYTFYQHFGASVSESRNGTNEQRHIELSPKTVVPDGMSTQQIQQIIDAISVNMHEITSAPNSNMSTLLQQVRDLASRGQKNTKAIEDLDKNVKKIHNSITNAKPLTPEDVKKVCQSVLAAQEQRLNTASDDKFKVQTKATQHVIKELKDGVLSMQRDSKWVHDAVEDMRFELEGNKKAVQKVPQLSKQDIADTINSAIPNLTEAVTKKNRELETTLRTLPSHYQIDAMQEQLRNLARNYNKTANHVPVEAATDIRENLRRNVNWLRDRISDGVDRVSGELNQGTEEVKRAIRGLPMERISRRVANVESTMVTKELIHDYFNRATNWNKEQSDERFDRLEKLILESRCVCKQPTGRVEAQVPLPQEAQTALKETKHTDVDDAAEEAPASAHQAGRRTQPASEAAQEAKRVVKKQATKTEKKAVETEEKVTETEEKVAETEEKAAKTEEKAAKTGKKVAKTEDRPRPLPGLEGNVEPPQSTVVPPAPSTSLPGLGTIAPTDANSSLHAAGPSQTSTERSREPGVARRPARAKSTLADTEGLKEKHQEDAQEKKYPQEQKKPRETSRQREKREIMECHAALEKIRKEADLKEHEEKMKAMRLAASKEGMQAGGPKEEKASGDLKERKGPETPKEKKFSDELKKKAPEAPKEKKALERPNETKASECFKENKTPELKKKQPDAQAKETKMQENIKEKKVLDDPKGKEKMEEPKENKASKEHKGNPKPEGQLSLPQSASAATRTAPSKPSSMASIKPKLEQNRVALGSTSAQAHGTPSKQEAGKASTKPMFDRSKIPVIPWDGDKMSMKGARVGEFSFTNDATGTAQVKFGQNKTAPIRHHRDASAPDQAQSLVQQPNLPGLGPDASQLGSGDTTQDPPRDTDTLAPEPGSFSPVQAPIAPQANATSLSDVPDTAESSGLKQNPTHTPTSPAPGNAGQSKLGINWAAFGPSRTPQTTDPLPGLRPLTAAKEGFQATSNPGTSFQPANSRLSFARALESISAGQSIRGANGDTFAGSGNAGPMTSDQWVDREDEDMKDDEDDVQQQNPSGSNEDIDMTMGADYVPESPQAKPSQSTALVPDDYNSDDEDVRTTTRRTPNPVLPVDQEIEMGDDNQSTQSDHTQVPEQESDFEMVVDDDEPRPEQSVPTAPAKSAMATSPWSYEPIESNIFALSEQKVAAEKAAAKKAAAEKAATEKGKSGGPLSDSPSVPTWGVAEILQRERQNGSLRSTPGANSRPQTPTNAARQPTSTPDTPEATEPVRRGRKFPRTYSPLVVSSRKTSKDERSTTSSPAPKTPVSAATDARRGNNGEQNQVKTASSKVPEVTGAASWRVNTPSNAGYRATSGNARTNTHERPAERPRPLVNRPPKQQGFFRVQAKFAMNIELTPIEETVLRLARKCAGVNGDFQCDEHPDEVAELRRKLWGPSVPAEANFSNETYKWLDNLARNCDETASRADIMRALWKLIRGGHRW